MTIASTPVPLVPLLGKCLGHAAGAEGLALPDEQLVVVLVVAPRAVRSAPELLGLVGAGLGWFGLASAGLG